MEFTYESIRERYKNKGYIFHEEIGRINICGVRSDQGKVVTDKFDDLIIVTYKDSDKKGYIKQFPGTTDPGLYFIEKPMNPRGTIRMIPGFYENAYIPGLHFDYRALRQHSKIKFWLDNDKDKEYDEGNIIDEICGANIHHGFNSPRIGNNSAGCQVVWMTRDFNKLMFLVDCNIQNGHGELFHYGLFDEVEAIKKQPIIQLATKITIDSAIVDAEDKLYVAS